MKMRFILTLCVIALFGLNSFAQQTGAQTKDPGKPYNQSDYPQLRAGGENIATAVIIADLPYADGGTTCGAADDYAANCGCCGGSNGAPDLVYAYTADHNGPVNFDLTGNYDVLIHVRDAVGNVLGCSDDTDIISHAVINMPLVDGQTYYIVAEGYASNCGDYTLSITEGIPGEVPLSGWAIGIAIFLIASVVVIRYIKFS